MTGKEATNAKPRRRKMSNRPTLEERETAQEDASRLIIDLHNTGLTPEQLCVQLGEYLGGAHPSVQTIARWKAGQVAPNKANAVALAKLYKERIGAIV